MYLRLFVGVKMDKYIQKEIEKQASDFWQKENDSLVQDKSHFRGGKKWNNQKWFEWGILYEHLLVRYFSKYDDEFLTNIHLKTALEWGTGGGVNLRILSHLFKNSIGVDISKSNLLETKGQLESFGLNNYTPIYIPIDQQDLVSSKIGESSIDFVLCAAVFQHMPSQNYVEKVIIEMHKLIKSNGYALFQTRHNEGDNFCKDVNYVDNYISFTTFTTSEFSRLLDSVGFEVIDTRMGKDFDFIEPAKRDALRKADYEYFFVRKS